MGIDLSSLKKYMSLPSRGNRTFNDYLKQLLEDYCNIDLRQFEEKLFPDSYNDEVRYLCRRINTIVKKALDGNPFLAVKTFLDTKLFNFSTFTYNTGCSFYRMRVADNKRNLEVGDLFHIPFSLQGKVETQRYSAPGLPCLYAGSSIYGCWEEMRRPVLSRCLVSRCETMQDINCLDLIIPDYVNNINELKTVLNTIPFIIACSIKVDDNRRKNVFKPEYIVSQILLQVISIYNENKYKNRWNKKIIGIRYRSVHYNNDFGFPESKFDNIVVPSRSTGFEYDTYLCKLFQLTKPTCEDFERIRHRDVILDGNFGENRSSLDLYNKSLFGELEKFTKDKTIFPLQIVNNKKLNT